MCCSWKVIAVGFVAFVVLCTPFGVLIGARLHELKNEIETDVSDLIQTHGGEVKNYIPTLKTDKIESKIQTSNPLDCECYNLASVQNSTRDVTLSFYDISESGNVIAIRYDSHKVHIIWDLRRRKTEKGLVFSFNQSAWNKKNCIIQATTQRFENVKRRAGKHLLMNNEYKLSVTDGYLLKCENCRMSIIPDTCN
jgi:hypothetical protein